VYIQAQEDRVPSETMTIRLDGEVKRKLERLSESSSRSKSYLAAEAVAAYVDRELEIVEGIERGLADADAGRVVPHEEAMARIDAVIEAAEQRRERDAHRQVVRKRAR
jgi:predicted transcriptional regulator